VDAVIALTDQLTNVVDTNVSAIRQLFGASGHKPARRNAENDRLKNRLIPFVKRTIDEYASAGGRWHLGVNCVESPVEQA
jgi:hypothetical protein